MTIDWLDAINVPEFPIYNKILYDWCNETEKELERRYENGELTFIQYNTKKKNIISSYSLRHIFFIYDNWS